MVYYVVILPLFFISLSNIWENKRNEKSFLFFICILIGLSSLRFEVGTDYNNYVSIWNDITPMIYGVSGREYLENGFRYFVSFLKVFSDSFFLFFYGMAVLIFSFLYFGLKKIKNINLIFSLFIYFMVFYIPYALNAMRQAVAMSVYIYSLYYIINKKSSMVFLLSIFAGFFHFSGFFIFPAYLISRLNIRIKTFFILGLIVSLCLSQLEFLKVVIDYISPGKYEYYFFHYDKLSFYSILIRTFLVLFFVFVYVFFNQDKALKKILLMYLVGYFLYIALMDVGMMATRINMFFRILEIIMFPKVLWGIKRRGNKVLVYLLVVCIESIPFFEDSLFIDNQYKTIFSQYKLTEVINYFHII